DYRFYAGPRSTLGAASKARIADHLERIREYELRAFSHRSAGDSNDGPKRPPASHLLHGGAADPGGEGIDITLDDLSREWQLMADLYALAIQTDRTRFGSLTFLAAGERIRLTGTMNRSDGGSHTFDDSNILGRGGSAGCSHEFWHKFNPKKQNEQLRQHAMMKLQQVAYFLKSLDSSECREANGKTILENSLITISTESGDGRHNDVKRELSGVFHAVTGAAGRLKTGEILDVNAEGLDVYNTILESHGVSKKLGPKERNVKRQEAMLA
ncbi:MAG: DUF1552 domain-containing protein, partial [Planctomycetota bacterium]